MVKVHFFLGHLFTCSCLKKRKFPNKGPGSILEFVYCQELLLKVIYNQSDSYSLLFSYIQHIDIGFLKMIFIVTLMFLTFYFPPYPHRINTDWRWPWWVMGSKWCTSRSCRATRNVSPSSKCSSCLLWIRCNAIIMFVIFNFPVY